MPKHLFRDVSAALAFLGCLVAIGCGGASGIKPKGTLKQAGKPLTVSEQGHIEVSFIAKDSSKVEAFYAIVNKADGTFEVPGNDGRGIPSGNYKVVVRVYDPYVDSDASKSKDKLNGKYAPATTPLVKEVKSGESIDLDL